MRLPRGVTGFARRGKKDPPLPATDVRAFRGHCHAAARAAGATVRGFEPAYHFTNKYAACLLDVPPGPHEVAVLLHAHFPYVAFAAPPLGLGLAFVDAPALVEAFRSFGVYDVLDRLAAETPLTADAVADLHKWER